MVALKGGLSALAAHVLKLFYSKDGWKFETVGVRVPCTCGQPYLVRAQFAAILADEKAIKEVWSLNGIKRHEAVCVLQERCWPHGC